MSQSTMTDVQELPIFTHTYVLGAEIGVSQRDTMSHRYHGHKTRDTAVEVNAYDGLPHQHPQRKYIAAWARRTLFSGDAE